MESGSRAQKAGFRRRAFHAAESRSSLTSMIPARWFASLAVPVALVSGACCLTACGAVFPEITPNVKPPPAGREITPKPPQNLVYVAFAGAEIPPTTRDGRKWDSIGGDLPDPFAKVFVDDREIFRTP